MLTAVDAVEITILVDNLSDSLLPATPIARQPRKTIEESPSAAKWSVEIASAVCSTSTGGLPDRGDPARCSGTG
jgi:hypothetical protein